MNLNLASKRACILGLQGTGKTVLAKHIVGNNPNAFVYDTLQEYKALDCVCYFPEHRDYTKEGIVEINLVLDNVFIKGKHRFDLLLIDEANRYCPNKRPLPSKVGYLNDFQRHKENPICLGMTFITIARRPVQLNTDLMELAHYLFIFRLKGKNDVKYLNDYIDGLGDTVSRLKDYYFVVVDEKKNIKIHSPVRLK